MAENQDNSRNEVEIDLDKYMAMIEKLDEQEDTIKEMKEEARLAAEALGLVEVASDLKLLLDYIVSDPAQLDMERVSTRVSSGTNELLNSIKKLKSPPTLIYPRTFYENHFNEISELSKNPYFATKFASTNIVKLWSDNNLNIPVIFTTIFQVYGIGDDKKNVLSYTIDSINKGKAVNLGNPDILRDWIYIEDLIDVFMKLINQKNKATSFYDLGTGNLFTLKNMIDIIKNYMNKKNPKLNYNTFKNTFDFKVNSSAKLFVPGCTQSFSNETRIKEFINSSLKSN